MEPKKAEKQVTDTEIREALGPNTDDSLVMAIRGTGASYGDIIQAMEWLEDDDYMGKNLKKSLTGPVKRVYELLLEEREDTNDR